MTGPSTSPAPGQRASDFGAAAHLATPSGRWRPTLRKASRACFALSLHVPDDELLAEMVSVNPRFSVTEPRGTRSGSPGASLQSRTP